MKIVLRVPAELPGARTFVQELSRVPCWQGIELSGTVLGQGVLADHVLEAIQLPLIHLHQLVPESTSRYIAETPPEIRDVLLGSVRRQMEKAAGLGFEFASLTVGIGRAGSDPDSPAVTDRIAIMRTLTEAASPLDLNLCLPQRLPAAQPGAQVDVILARIIDSLAQSNLGITLNVFPDEVPLDFNARSFIDTVRTRVAVVRILYEPLLGITLTGEMHQQWATALRGQFDGPVVFCPTVESVDHLEQECETLHDMIQHYWQ